MLKMLFQTEREAIERQALQRLQRDIGGEIVGKRLLPIGADLAQFVRQEHVSCEVIGDWFAVCAKPRQQNMAVESIGEAGLPAYLPVVSKEERHGRGSTRKVARPMFGSYLFARCKADSRDWQKITAARGVHRILDVTGNGRPLPVPPGAIQVIRAIEAEANTLIGRSKIVWHFTKGDVVRIKNGPFAGFYAELESAVDEQGRIRALVGVFGRPTTCTFDAAQLEAL